MGFISSALSFISNERANKQAASLSKKQMEWQERLSNTAHQREVADLREAGLNPILSATGGSGASVPAGSVPQIKSTQFDFDDTLGLSSALALHNSKLQNDLLSKQMDEIDSRIDLNSAQATKSRADANSLMNLPGKALNSIPNSAINWTAQKISDIEQYVDRSIKSHRDALKRLRNEEHSSGHTDSNVERIINNKRR